MSKHINLDAIKKLVDQGWNEIQIARKWGVKPESVYKIIKNLGKIKYNWRTK